MRVDPLADLERQVQELSDQVAQLQEQLAQVYQLPQIQQLIAQEEQRRQQEALEKQPLDVTLDVSGAPFKGDPNAPLTIVEFSDYQCPACGAFANRIEPQVIADFVDTGQAKLVFFDYPLQRHEYAFRAAEAARCAGDQGKYWEMHDQLYANQQQIGEQQLPEHAAEIGLDVEAFSACLDSETHADGIRADMAEAGRVRLRGTPHFAIGHTAGDGTEVRVVRAMSGGSYPKIQEVIDELTAGAE